MLFTNQKLKNGLLIGGDVSPNPTHSTLNSVMDPGSFIGAYLNKDLFSTEETPDIDHSFYSNISEIQSEISGIINNMKEITEQYDLNEIYDYSKYVDTVKTLKEDEDKEIDKEKKQVDFRSTITHTVTKKIC